MLKGEKSGLVMVFCNTRQNADFVAENLERNQVEAMAIHGGLSQQKRNKILYKRNKILSCLLFKKMMLQH